MSNIRTLLDDLIKRGHSSQPRELPRPPVAPTQHKPVVGRTASRRESNVKEEFEVVCQHQWSWKDGIKRCWLCHQQAPPDERSRRDKSTTWQAKVYGGKR